GSLTVTLPAGAVTDTFGNPGAAFSGSYTVIPGLVVTASTPADRAIVATRPTSYVITFSDAVNPASVQAGDFTVISNGVSHAATGVSLSGGNTVATFTFGTEPLTIEGVQTMVIAADAIARASDGDGVAAFSATFRWDAVTLAVTSTSPPSGGVFTLPTPFTYDLTFNEAIDPSSAEGSV